MIHYLINMDGLEEIEAALHMTKDKSKQVLKSAINSAAKEVEKRMMKGAGKRYARFKRGMKPYKEVTDVKPKATLGRLEAIIRATDTASDLIDYTLNDATYYPGSVGAPSWIKGKQLRSGKLKNLAARPGGGSDQYKAFVVRYPKQNHYAVAERVPGKRMKSNPAKEAIRSLYATSKPKAEEMIYKKDIDDDMHEILIRNIETQMQRFLK